MNARVYLIMVLMVSATMVSLVGSSDIISAADKRTTDIELDGDNEIINSGLVDGGSGTYGSPYIIADLEMGEHSIKISNNTGFITFMNITFSEGDEYAFCFYFTRGITLRNITVSGNRQFLKAERSQNTYVTECTITNAPTGKRTIQNIDSPGTSLIDNSFSCYGNSEINFHKGSGPVIRGNTFEGMTIIDTEYTMYDDVSYNEFNNSNLKINNSNNYPSVHHNSFRSDYGNGLTLDFCKEINIYNNSFTAPVGIYFPVTFMTYGQVTSSIYDNTFEDCGVGIGGENDYTSCSRPSGIEIKDNLFYNSTGHAIDLCAGRYNRVYRNLFIDNNGVNEISGAKQCTQLIGGTYDFVPKWDYNGEGNYWSDHTGPDADLDGVVDSKYPIAYLVDDRFPCTNKYFDFAKPEIDLFQPDEDTRQISYLEMRWDAEDEHSGLEELTLKANDNEFDVLDIYSCRLFFEQGTHKVTLTGKDRAGLVNTSVIDILVIENNEIIKILNYETGDIVSEDAPELIWEVQRYFQISEQTLTINGIPVSLPTGSRKHTLDLSTGENEMVLTVNDGKFTEVSHSLKLVKDSQAPTINIVSPVTGMTYSNNFISTIWTISDDLKLDTSMWKIDDQEWLETPFEMNGHIEISEGDHILTVKAMDLGGNFAEVEVPFSVGDDSDLQLISPNSDLESRLNDIVLEWDYGGDFKWVQVQLRIGESSQFIEIPHVKQGSVKIGDFTNNVVDGEYEVTIRLLDDHGNYIETSQTMVRDTLAPRVLFIEPAGFPNFKESEIQISWKGYEENSLAGYKVRIDDGLWEDVGKETSYHMDLVDGDHTLYVETTDKAGNRNVYTMEFNIDSTSPEVHILSPANMDVIKDGFVDLEWDILEDGNVVKALVFLDGSEIRNATGLARRSFIIEEEGEHTVALVVWDESGNTGSDEITVTVDKEPAEVEWSRIPSELINEKDHKIEWTCNDNIGVELITLFLDGKEIEMNDIETSIELELEDGTHTLELEVSDLGGHTTMLKHVFRVDTTAPKVKVDVERTMVQDMKIDIYFDVAPDDSKTLPIELRIDDGEFMELKNNRVYTSEELEVGLHVITIKATDEAGNVHEEKYHFEITDDSIGPSSTKAGGSTLLIIAGVAGMVLILAGVSTMMFLKKRKANTKVPDNGTLSTAVKRPQDRMTLPAPVTPLADNRCLPPAAGYVETVQGLSYHRPDHK